MQAGGVSPDERDKAARKQVFASRWTTSDGKWSAPKQLSNDLGDATGPRVGLDASGNALAVWLQATPGPGGMRQEVWTARYVAGDGWQAATPRSNQGAVSAPRLALDARGRGFVMWREMVRGVVFQRFE